MGSAAFRIIPHEVAVSRDGTKPDLYRYIVAYTSSQPPRFVASAADGALILTQDEKRALRFATAEDAEEVLSRAQQTLSGELLD